MIDVQQLLSQIFLSYSPNDFLGVLQKYKKNDASVQKEYKILLNKRHSYKTTRIVSYWKNFE